MDNPIWAQFLSWMGSGGHGGDHEETGSRPLHAATRRRLPIYPKSDQPLMVAPWDQHLAIHHGTVPTSAGSARLSFKDVQEYAFNEYALDPSCLAMGRPSNLRLRIKDGT